MNIPDRSEAILLPFGAKKVTVTEDTRLPNAIEVKIEREDHTIGALLKAQLLKDKNVIFAGYKHPHPLVHHIILKIQSIDLHSPIQALREAIQNLIYELATIKSRFMDQVKKINAAKTSGAAGDFGGENDMDY